MRKGLICCLVVALVLMGQFLIAQKANAKEVDLGGVWEGKLAVSGIELRIVFNVEATSEGYEATMDSPDQGAQGIPVSAVKIVDDQIIFEIAAAAASFEGTMNATNQEIDGVWKQGGVTFPLKVEKQAGPVVINRPQEPKKPYPYKEEEVTYENEIDGITLAGTLTIPEGQGPYPAVLLITGSGAQDRDESLMGHKPFLVIADYLTRHGIAVLRVDDRGVGGSTGNITTATSADFVKDVLAGIEFLKSHPEIRKDQIGLIGHSEGGMIAPMVENQSDDVAFIVLMAAPGIPIDELMLLQLEDVNRAAGVSEDDIREALVYQKELIKIANEAKDDQQGAAELRQKLEEILNLSSEEEKQAVIDSWGSLEAYVENNVATFLTPWYRYFLAFDPVPILSKVTCPVLAINGSKDVQVAAKPNLESIEKSLKAAGNQDVTIKEYPNLNHLFQTADTGSPTEYGIIEETITPVVLEDMAQWILQHVSSGQ